MSESWSIIDNAWVNSGKTESQYNDNKQITVHIEWVWQNDQWVQNVKTNYLYDDENNLSTLSFQLWQNEQWTNSDQELYYYDNHQLSKAIQQKWDDVQLKYTDTYKYEYQYNDFAQITQARSFEYVDPVWRSSDGINLYYEAFVSGAGVKKSRATTNIQVYPNPFNDQLNISVNGGYVNQVKVTDISGNLVFISKNLQGTTGVSIPAHSWAAGSYIVQVRSNGVWQSQSVILSK